MRWYRWVFWVLVGLWIVQAPVSAAHFARGVGGGISHAGRSFGILMDNL